MPDEISTYFLFADSPKTPLGTILSSAVDEGWEVEQVEHEGKYRYLIDYQRNLAEDVGSVVSEIDDGNRSSVWIERGDLSFCLKSNTELLADEYQPNIHIWMDKYDGFLHQDSSRSQEEARETVETYLDVVGLVVESTDPPWGFGKFGDPGDTSKLPSKQQLGGGYTDALYWLTIFDEAAVEQIGRDHLLSTPSYYAREFNTGHVMVVLSDNPVEPAEEFSETAQRAREHLGLEN